jgi:hypothetical protein
VPERSGMGRLPARTRLIVIAALGLVVAAVGALILGGEVSGSRAGAAAKTKGSGSATVARRDLIQTDTESGTLSYADSRTVFNRLSGTITSLPAAGTVVKPGGVLFTVDNSPVVLMDGALPAYRSLSDGVADGPDVRELEQNLVTLGYDPTHAMTVDDHFDAATTAAVDRWQAATGQTQTGTVTLGQVVFLPGARRVSAVSASLGSTGGSGTAGATGASLRLPTTGHTEFVDLTTPTTTSTSTSTSTTTTTTTTSSTTSGRGGTPAQSGASTPTLLALIALLRAEVAELKAAQRSAAGGSTTSRSATTGAGAGGTSGTSGGSGGTRSSGAPTAAAGSSGASSAGAGGGSSSATGAAAAQAVLSTTSTQLVATVPLDASKQSEAVLQAPVTVQMPDGSSVNGRISQVAAAAQTTSSSSSSGGSGSGSGGTASGSGSTASSTVPVTITLHGRVRTAGLDQAAVSVNFEQQKALGVLSVPVTALLATAGGGYAIQPVAQPHQLIPVTPGLFAAGYVQISGTGVVDGLAVTDSQG